MKKLLNLYGKKILDQYKDIEVFVATPVHSEVSIHYTQALIEFQQECFKKKLKSIFSFN